MTRTTCALILVAVGLGATACTKREEQALTEAVTRNAAAVAGTNEFKDAGHELTGRLTCTTSTGDAFTVTCTGTTKAGNQPVSMTGQVAKDATAGSDTENGVKFEGLEFVGKVADQEVFRKTCIGSGC